MLRVDIYSWNNPRQKEPEINIWFTYEKGDDKVVVHSLEENLVLVDNIKKHGIVGRKMKRFLLTDKEKFLEELRFEFSGSYLRASEPYEFLETSEDKKMAKLDAIETIDDFSGEFLENEKFCEDCKHFHDDWCTCEAFPEGIPTKYLTGAKEHTSPLKIQGNKIVWELDPKQKFERKLQKILENSEHKVIECGEDYEKAKREEQKLIKLEYDTSICTYDSWPITYTVHGTK